MPEIEIVDCPSRMRCRARISSSICVSAAGIASPVAADIMMSSSQSCPFNFFMTVVYGMKQRVVLVLAGRGLSLRAEHADDPARLPLHADGFADWLLLSEQLIDHGLAEHADRRGPLDVGSSNMPPFSIGQAFTYR